MATPTPPVDPPVEPPADPIAVLPAEAVKDLLADPVAAPDLPGPGLETPPVGAVPMPARPAPSLTDPGGASAPQRTVRALSAISTVGPISGIFFVALFLTSFLTMNTPEPDEGNRAWTSYWEDSGNRTAGMTASVAMLLAAVAFLWLVAALRRRLTPAIGTDAFYASGIAAGGLMFVAGFGAGLIPFGNELGDVPIPDDADVIRMLDGLYHGTIFLPLPYALAGFLIPLFFALRGSFLVPRWLEYATLLVGVVCLTGPLLFVVPHALFMLWTLAVSVTLLLRERDVPPPTISL
ncbi:hypothetical protein [Sporichthya sp.]|uniref:hypothetical protein n=1 Tax=Sporichthya sp. TaxID=65475 RepID=UPI001844B7BD|nr:hypothetical protein [Sporichthya sp.]MBA3742907.1 hypothetical protein [Sporichthya sp.]